MEEDIETCGWFVFYKDQLLIEKKERNVHHTFRNRASHACSGGKHYPHHRRDRGTHCQDFLRTCPGARQRKMTAT